MDQTGEISIGRPISILRSYSNDGIASNEGRTQPCAGEIDLGSRSRERKTSSGRIWKSVSVCSIVEDLYLPESKCSRPIVSRFVDYSF